MSAEAYRRTRSSCSPRSRAALTTQEVAQLLTRGNDAPDRVEAEVAMLRLVADGTATRTPLGDDALWLPASVSVAKR